MKNLMIVLALTAIGLVFTTEALAQRGMHWRGDGGWGPGSPYGRIFNPQTVETIRGEVVSVERITPRRGMSHGVHAMVRTDGETISVHLGPGWFIENQDMEIEPEDQIEVRGSRVTLNGKTALIAAEVRKGDNVLVLRDTRGIPVWSGWRRRQAIFPEGS